MTITQNLTGIWNGETVAVLGSGPSLTREIADELSAHRRIAVNHAIALAPGADMLVALDGDWPAEFREFPGLRVIGCEDESIDAIYIGHKHDLVEIGTNHSIYIRNSGLTAIRIAADAGAARIILAGFDPETSGHFDGYPIDEPGEQYTGLAAGINALIEQLRARGIAVERATESAGNLHGADATAAPSTDENADVDGLGQ